MLKIKSLIILFLSFYSLSTYAQMRYGSCKGITSADKIYITPFVGVGLGNEDFVTKENIFTYQGGLTVLYNFGNFRLGLGGKYQVHKKKDVYLRKTIKPFAVIEVPIYFGEFEDFGFYSHLGPSFYLDQSGNTPNEMAFFVDVGIYYNLIIAPSSGLYFGLDYGYNYVFFPDFVNGNYNINEFKLNIGYRFWF